MSLFYGEFEFIIICIVNDDEDPSFAMANLRVVPTQLWWSFSLFVKYMIVMGKLPKVASQGRVTSNFHRLLSLFDPTLDDVKSCCIIIIVGNLVM